MRTKFAILLVIAGLMVVYAAGASGAGPTVGSSPNPDSIRALMLGAKGLPPGPPNLRPPIQGMPPTGAENGRLQMPAPPEANAVSELPRPFGADSGRLRMPPLPSGHAVPVPPRPIALKRGAPRGGAGIAALPGNWDDEVRLTSASRYDYLYYANGRKIAVGQDGRVHVVWFAYNYTYPYGYFVFYKRYNPGFGWSSDTVLSTSTNSYYPAIALDSNGTSVHVVWMDYSYSDYSYHIYHVQCDPAGEGNSGWVLPAEDVATVGSNTGNYYPSVACSPDRVHVAWTWESYDGTSWQEGVGYRERIGGAWQTQIVLDKNTAGYYRYLPSIAANQNHDVAMSWYGNDSNWNWTCYGDKRVNGAWTEGVSISSDLTGSYYWPVSCLDAGGKWHVVWYGYGPDYVDRVYYRSQDISGSTWSGIDTVSPDGGDDASMDVSPNGRAHVVWIDYSHYSIRYRMRDAGGTWQPIEDVSPSDDGNYRDYPSITADKDNFAHVVWDDTRNGYWNIYYRRQRPARDLACTKVITPSGVYTKGTTVYPEIKLANMGTDAQTGFPVTVWIDAGGTRVYNATQTFSGTLAPGDTAHFALTTPFTVNYPLCRVTAFTDLSGDQRRANDTAFTNCLGADFIQDFETSDAHLQASPASGGWAWGTPSGGSRPAPHSGTHLWGDVLSGSYRLGARDSLQMGPLTATVDTPMVGWWSSYQTYDPYDGYALYFSTDNGSSWTMTHAVPGFSRGYDGLIYIYPVDSAYSGHHSGWEQMVHKIPVPNGGSFRLMWVLRGLGYWGNDGVLIDDLAGLGFRPAALDVGVTKILAPSGIVPLDPFAPKAVIRNFGTQATPFDVTFSINCTPPYQRTVNVTVPPWSDDTVQFPNWTPIDGYFTARCQTFLTGDERPGNDWETLDFIAAPYGWSGRTKMPTLPSGKADGAGGWLTYNSGDGLIYAAKGENTSDFYSYNLGTNEWTPLPPIPMGRENALPGDGCRGEADGQDNIYMTKGANTLGFWRYTISTQTWTQLADVPAGKEKVKGGTDLVYYRNGYYSFVYLLKGQNCEFYRYWADGDNWLQLTDAPSGSNAHWLAGSWLVSDGGDWLYAHKARTQEMYRNHIWGGLEDPTLVPGIPLISRYGGGKLPLGTGGCASSLGGAIYALKGNNTTQFWKYVPGDNAWSELDTMPQVGTSGLPRRVHAGGDITSTADFLFAFKGSNTNELWRYRPRPESSLLAREGVQASPSVIPLELALSVSPNPVRLGTSIHYAVPAAANVSLKLYNVTGALAKTVSNGRVKAGRYTVSLSAKGLARGVYILKLQSDAGNLTRKVVIE